MQVPDAQAGAGGRGRRRGRRTIDAVGFERGGDAFVRLPVSGGTAARGGRGGARGGVARPSKEIVHHNPPNGVAANVGYPVRGGQTLLIAYFPWEASEADIEREFSRFCRVKRVHLVVDKSSKKPRCFGFVKFMSKVDAEEALQATTQGLVQLPDTRGHVWHLKAEWTKSGDMVVDDSETEQEVAKRKEERRSRNEQRNAGGGAPLFDGACCAVPEYPQAKGGRRLPAAPPRGALHPGVPAPLPPLQTPYPPAQSALSLQGPMPVMQPPQNHLGLVGSIGAQAPPLAAQQGHMQHMLPPQQPVPPNPGVAQQQVYPRQQGQQLFGAASPGPSVYGSLGGSMVPQLSRDIGIGLPPQGQAVGTLTQDAPGLASGSRSYGSVPPAFVGSQPAFPAAAQQQGFAFPQQPPQGFVARQPGGHAFPAGQQSFSAGQDAFAPQQPGFAPQPPGYTPQQQHQQGYPAQAFAASYSARQDVAQQGLPQQGSYGFLQKAGGATAAAAPGIVSYSSYPGGAAAPVAAAPPLQPTAATPAAEDGTGSQEPAGAALPGLAPHVVVGQEPTGAALSGLAPHVAVGQAVQPPLPYMRGSQHLQQPAPQPAPPPGPFAPPPARTAADAALQGAAAGAATPPGAAATAAQAVAAAGADAQYLDMVWQLSEMSLGEKPTPVPIQPLPAQASQQPSAAAVRRSDWDAMPTAVPTLGPSAGSGPSAVWNSFDDAAAKGMVDGLVGREDGVSPLMPAWSTHSA